MEIAQSMGIHASPFGVIPKKNHPVVDCEPFCGFSVNDGIEKEPTSMSYR